LLDHYLKEQYNFLGTKPNGMMGHWGFQSTKSREFKELMIKEGKVKIEKVQLSAKST
jgi:hypothetical protein